MPRILLATITTCLVAALSGCGGGGSSATLSPFTSWGAVQPNSSITVEGISQSGTYSWNSGTNRVTATSLGTSTSGASYSAVYDANGQATSITLSPANSTAVSWSRGAGDTFGALLINNNIDAVVSADGTKYALAANPYDHNWNYQSFGIWTTGAGTGNGTYGAMSVGASTAGNAIPTSGTATYSGYTGGRYVNSSGQYWFTSSTMTAAADFTNRSLAFSTANTQVTPDLISSSNNTALNMSGTLTYSAATNQVTGNVTTTGGMSGSVNARFYGPSAQEIGGTFAVSSGALSGYAGAFGGKR